MTPVHTTRASSNFSNSYEFASHRLLRKIQPISIHGQISWDVYYTYADDPKEQVAMARVGPESMDRGLEPGDRIRLHLVLGAVTDITRTDEPAA